MNTNSPTYSLDYSNSGNIQLNSRARRELQISKYLHTILHETRALLLGYLLQNKPTAA
jgi:hypothetical protein